MLRIFNRKRRLWQLRKEEARIQEAQEPNANAVSGLSGDLDADLAAVSDRLGQSSDLVLRQLTLGRQGQARGGILFLDGLVDTAQVDRDILAPLLRIEPADGGEAREDLLRRIRGQVLALGGISAKNGLEDIVESVLSGDTVFLLDGCREALTLGTRGWEKRSIEEPPSEVVIRGPREGFTETLRSNTAMLRRKIRNPNLTFLTAKIGVQTKTDVCIAYIKGLCPEELVEEIKRRLRRIKTDSILESGYIEEFIQDAPFSIFPTMYHTERPDAVAGRLLEGRAAILVAGTPFVLTVPTMFVEYFQSPEDYYSRFYYGSLIRIIRYVAFLINLVTPAIFVSLVNFHQELLPTPLLISLAASREGLPFPVLAEAIGMGLTFEIIREAGIRLPRPVGQAISIVGALVIGQTAVSAGLIGAPMVIIVASTAITSFVNPFLSDLSAILRVALTILAGTLGAFGIIIGLIFILIHLAKLRSFGVPYLAPITPLSLSGQKDVALRVPWWAMRLRPGNLGREDEQRQEFRLIPHRPDPGDKRPQDGPTK